MKPAKPPAEETQRRGAWARLAAGLVAAGGLLLASTTAQAAAGITEFSAGISPNAGLGDIAVDHEGGVWFTEANADRVGRITSSGAVTAFGVSGDSGLPFVPTSIAIGQSGDIWVVGSGSGGLRGLNPEGAPRGTHMAETCDAIDAPSPNSQLTTGHGTLLDGVTSQTAPAEVRSVSICGEDAVVASFWWSVADRSLGSFAPGRKERLTQTAGCYANRGPFIAGGPAGETWVSCYDESLQAIARVSANTPDDIDWTWSGFAGIPGPLVAAPDGSVWFTQSADPPPFAGSHRNGIGRLTAQGQVTSFHAGLTGMGLHQRGAHGITVGPDGNIWFTEPAADRIGRITPAGVITEFALAPGANPQAITAGPGRTLWFTQPGVNRIGRIDLNEAPGASIGVGGSLITDDQVVFDGSGSPDPDGAVVGHRWDFGDGSGAAGARVSHTYARAGTYTVTLVVTDNEGGQARAQRQVVISNPAVRVQGTTASVRWSLEGAAGGLRITGSSDRATRVIITLVRGRSRFTLGRFDIPAGPFTIRAAAPRALRPGRYQVLAVPVASGGPPIELGITTLQVAAPRHGIVDGVAVLDARGRPARSVRPLGTRRLMARFHMAVAPRSGTRVEARWKVPGRSRQIVDPAPDARKGGFVVSSIFSRRSPLPQGLYVCQLRAGGVLVASARMRIG